MHSMCVLGRRLLKDINIENCTKEVNGPLWEEFCVVQNNTKNPYFTRDFDRYKSEEKNWECDSYFKGLFFQYIHTIYTKMT